MVKSISSPCNCEEAKIGSSCNKSVYATQTAADADIQSFFSTQFGFGQPNIPVPWQDVRPSNMVVDAGAPGIKHEFSTEFTTGPLTNSVSVIHIFQVRNGCAGTCQNYIITKKTDPCGINLIVPTLTLSSTTPSFNYRTYAVAANTTYIITRQVVYDGTSAPCFSSWVGTDGSPSGGQKVTAQHWFIYSDQGVLPVKELKLSANQLNNSVMLQWSTREEYNCRKFEIEKSIDGIQFLKMGETPASGNSSTLKQYWAEDHAPNATNYYRIKLTDEAGKSVYSDVSKINFNSKTATALLISPNPVLDNLNIAVESKTNTQTAFRILSAAGQLVQAGKITLKKGLNKTVIDFAGKAAGAYLLITEVNGERISSKFVKTN